MLQTFGQNKYIILPKQQRILMSSIVENGACTDSTMHPLLSSITAHGGATADLVIFSILFIASSNPKYYY